jgi:hypothetical protein
MADYHDAQLETELRELARLVKTRRRLETPAAVFIEHAPKGCHGECREPMAIGVLGLTCCNLFAAYEYHSDIMRRELLQRQLVEAVRDRHWRASQRKAPYACDDLDEYYRDFNERVSRLPRKAQLDAMVKLAEAELPVARPVPPVEAVA